MAVTDLPARELTIGKWRWTSARGPAWRSPSRATRSAAAIRLPSLLIREIDADLERRSVARTRIAHREHELRASLAIDAVFRIHHVALPLAGVRLLLEHARAQRIIEEE